MYKKGDRVRIVSTSSVFMEAFIGEEHTIKKVDNSQEIQLIYMNGGWCFTPGELVLVEDLVEVLVEDLVEVLVEDLVEDLVEAPVKNLRNLKNNMFATYPDVEAVLKSALNSVPKEHHSVMTTAIMSTVNTTIEAVIKELEK